MFSITPPVGFSPEPENPPLVEIGAYSRSNDAFDHGLVVLAMGRPYWVAENEGRYRLLVEPGCATDLREQLALYDRESVGWPPRPLSGDEAPRRRVWLSPLLWAIATLLAFQGQMSSGGRWEQAGAVDPSAIYRNGEWPRAFTALFLHGDVGHVTANVAVGVFVFSAVLSVAGRLRGWLLLALGGVGGNLAAAAIRQGEAYQSIGASTAIFGGLGILVGRAVRAAIAAPHPHRWRNIFTPLAAGLAMLGLFGAGGWRVDVLAHVCGFAVGVMGGLLVSRRSSASPPALSPDRA